MNTLLVASQVVLSFVLPFIAFPLVYITSSKDFMRVRKESDVQPQTSDKPEENLPDDHNDSKSTTSDTQTLAEEFVDFSNGRIVMILGYSIWFVVLLANAYVLVSLAVGKGSCEYII